MTFRVPAYCPLALLLAAAFVLPLAAQTTLQSRMDAAAEGDTIIVNGGTWTGNIVIGKRLRLTGVNSPVIRGAGTGSIVTILAPGCSIEGFVIEHCGTMLVNEDAGVLVKAGGTVVRGNILRDVLFGIYLYAADSNIVAGNEITGRPWLEQGGRGSGIHIWNSNRNVIERNVITQARDGIYIQNASHMMVRDNEVFGLRYGLHYMYADTNTFLRNVFRDNVAGAAIMFSRNIVMKQNVFVRNRGFASYGVLLQDCHFMVADSNVFSDNVVGLFFEASTDNRFRHNVVARNDLGLEMFQNSVRNAFTENNFVDNLSPLAIVGRRTESDWSVDGRGNYWSSYDGYDLDGDGTGDVPMKIENVFSYLEGKNANVRLYLYSPASQALAASAKAFPILELSGEVDEHPLTAPVPLVIPAGAPTAPSTPAAEGPSAASMFGWLAPVLASGGAALIAWRSRKGRTR